MTPNRFERLEGLGLVRFRVEPDDFFDTEDLHGDTFTPELHPEILREQILAEKAAEEDRINTYGIWGIVGEYRTAQGWETADSVWGFVDEDYKGSGYDDDVRQSAVDALREYIRNRCQCCKGRGQ